MTTSQLTALLAPYKVTTVAMTSYRSRSYIDRALAPYRVSR